MPDANFTENASRLRRCPGPHRFVELPGQENFFRDFRLYRCQTCGGEVDGATVAWYARGIEHGVLLGQRCESLNEQ